MISIVASPAGFQYLYMALAIDITDGLGLTNEGHRELLSKKRKLNLFVLLRMCS